MEKHYSSKSIEIEQKMLFIYFPFWNMEKAEKIMSEQERNGYRFVRLRLGCLFTFQKSAPRNVQYLINYCYAREYWPVLEWESILKSDRYSANVMHKGYMYSIFCITKDNVALQDFYKDRLRYVQKMLIMKALMAIFWILTGAFVSFSGNATVLYRIMFIPVFAGGLLGLLSYIVGFCSTIQQKKRLNHKHNRI